MAVHSSNGYQVFYIAINPLRIIPEPLLIIYIKQQSFNGHFCTNIVFLVTALFTADSSYPCLLKICNGFILWYQALHYHPGN
jgi:hypothetical protein